MGLQGIIQHMIRLCDFPTVEHISWETKAARKGDFRGIARLITMAERKVFTDASSEVSAMLAEPSKETEKSRRKVPVIGLTGHRWRG